MRAPIVFALVLLFVPASLLRAAEPAKTEELPKILIGRETLADHSQVMVQVSVSGEKIAKKFSIRTESVQDYVVKRLKAGGIPIVADFDGKNAGLIFTFEVGFVQGGPIYGFHVSGEASQLAKLDVNKRLAFVTTWSQRRFGVFGEDKSKAVRETVAQICDDFIASWKKAHEPLPDPFKEK